MKRAEFTPLGAERTSAPAPVTKNVAPAGTWDVGRGVKLPTCHTATRSPAQQMPNRSARTRCSPQSWQRTIDPSR